MTQAVPKERVLEHVVVVRILRICVSHIQKQKAEEGGSFHVRPFNNELASELQSGSLWIAVEAKKIWQDRVQKRVDEQ